MKVPGQKMYTEGDNNQPILEQEDRRLPERKMPGMEMMLVKHVVALICRHTENQ